MSEYVPETLPKITEEDWKSFAEKLKPYFTKEHQEIAKQIPCDDEELRMAFAMLMPGVSVQIDHSDLLFSTSKKTMREILKTKEGIECYKEFFFYLTEPETYYIPEKMNQHVYEKVSDEEWKEFMEILKPYWREEFQLIANQIPCDDEELRMAMAMVLYDVCKIFDKPVPRLGNITVREALKTEAGKQLCKRVVILERHPYPFWLPPDES